MKEDTFQQVLFRIIDRKGLTDPEVYKKANLDRKLFSKIRSDVEYTPSKRTVMALIIGLELNMDEAADAVDAAVKKVLEGVPLLSNKHVMVSPSGLTSPPFSPRCRLAALPDVDGEYPPVHEH